MALQREAARLASLTLSDVDFGEFSPGQPEYEGIVNEDATATTVEAQAVQSGARVVIAPDDSDEVTDGYQVALDDLDEITVTVTSADASRTKVYRVRIGGAADAGEADATEATEAATACLRGAVAVGSSPVVYEGGSIEDLVGCVQGRHITALYALDGGAYVSYILGAPEFVNRQFAELYAEAVPAATPLTVRSDGPATADPVPGVAVAEPWPECLRGDIAAGFSLVLYQGGSVADLDACAGALDVSALYVLQGGAWVSYILGAPDFVNGEFRELAPDGLPAITPLVAKSEVSSSTN